MACLYGASTSALSAGHTSRVIRPLLRWLLPKVSENEIDAIHSVVRKVAHFVGYAILGFLARRALISSARDFVRRYWFSMSALLVVVYALFDEWHQSLVPTRTGSIYDSGIDVAGGMTVLVLFWVFSRKPKFEK
jgi:VanZ family protein